MPRIDPKYIGGINVAAFLDAIAVCEIGPKLLAKTDDGYNVIVGSTPDNPTLFPTYTAHPKVKVWLSKHGIYSTAAGRYQTLGRYADHYMKLLKLSDFRPESQDLIAVRQIREFKAIEDIQAGRFLTAVQKVRTLWASLPGAGHKQNEQKIEYVKAAYLSNGGKLA